MAWLYTDTTNGLVVGILNDTFDWLEYVEKSNQKSTSDLHFLINDMFSLHKLSFEKLQGYLFAAGPGSYTGMRVSEGIAQILEWQKIKVYSFYHFEVPRMLTESEGIWFSEAFKGEYFLFDCSTNEKVLLDKTSFFLRIKDKNLALYTHYKSDNLQSLMDQSTRVQFTGNYIKNMSSKIFCNLVSSQKRVAPLYYRSEDKEFIPSKK